MSLEDLHFLQLRGKWCSSPSEKCVERDRSKVSRVSWPFFWLKLGRVKVCGLGILAGLKNQYMDRPCSEYLMLKNTTSMIRSGRQSKKEPSFTSIYAHGSEYPVPHPSSYVYM